MKPRWYNRVRCSALHYLFALLKLGVAPVLALFSHQRSELSCRRQPD
ncbi:hypothetical protein ACNKHM_04005 [Shigella sonnei]